MKQFLVAFVVIASCLVLAPGTAGQEPTTPGPVTSPAQLTPGSGRFFFFNWFNNNSSNPCTNYIYQMLNITDAKCSLSCYIQAGYQQGGYCDDNNVCQCNVIA